MSNDQPHKRMPLMMEESEYVVGLIDTPKNGATDWPLIINLLRSLADKIEECDNQTTDDWRCPACGRARGKGCGRDDKTPRVGCYLLGGPSP